MLNQELRLTAALLGLLSSVAAFGQDTADVSTVYQAMKCPAASLGTTWAILQRDGANRQTEPYLSSLGQGEAGVGVVSSPPFVIAGDSITCTVRGHDSREGGGGKNYVALVDARKGNVLMKTPPPGVDTLKETVWDVGSLEGKEVRVEIHDGDGGGAFAWLGVEQIDASPALKVDFRAGMPDGWERPEQKSTVTYETLGDGIPFMRNAAVFSLIPASGDVEFACGFEADRLFFLGCTVPGGQPLVTYGGIEIHYREGSPDVIPLLCGFTLDGRHKLLSPSMASWLHPTSDPYQNYLAIRPHSGVIEKIRLVAGPDRQAIPRITAITCRTSATSDQLMPLPALAPSTLEAAWLSTHTLLPQYLKLGSIMDTLRHDHRRMPNAATPVRFRKTQLDRAFRSEGLAVADFNGDGRLDVAAGAVYYAAPDWKRVPMFEEPVAFNRYGYSDAFLCYADDVDGDGATDLINVGFPGRQTHWLKNPSAAGQPWSKHLAIERTGNESPTYLDVDGDGRRELVFLDGGRCALASPAADPAQPWTIHHIASPGDPAPGHGLGVGDVNGDGRLDVLIPNGWWEGPSGKTSRPWKFHAAEFPGGAQLCVEDFDGDGDADVLGSSAHAYGIAWAEQTPQGWTTHLIDDVDSQTHALHMADINGDGLVDFVTGKRFWAHNGHDPGSFQPAVLCWYEQTRRGGAVEWVKHTIDMESGVGLHFQIIDLGGDGLLDIVTSNKKGVYYFQQTRE